jgi:hypothetical protein
LEIKKRRGLHLKNANDLFDKVDSVDFCQFAFDNIDDLNAFTVESCQKIYNSIFKRGLSEAQSLIFKQMTIDIIDYTRV